jgi:hypothetical protein
MAYPGLAGLLAALVYIGIRLCHARGQSADRHYVNRLISGRSEHAR